MDYSMWTQIYSAYMQYINNAVVDEIESNYCSHLKHLNIYLSDFWPSQ